MDPKDLPQPAAAPSVRYFAMTDGADIVEVGRFTDIESAFELEPVNTLWMFSEPCLRGLRDRINELLGD